MQLIERYIQAVKFWLPERQREDISAELQANILAQAEDKEAELGRPLQETEEVAILKQFGPPPLVAARYRQDQGTVAFGRQIIGPLVYPFYRVALKTTLAILAGIELLKTATFILHGNVSVMRAIVQAFWGLLDIAMVPLLLVTIAFAAIDWALREYRLAEKWDPRSLRPGQGQTQEIPRATSIAGIVVQVIFIAWWLGLPNFPEVFFGNLRPAPIWQTLYLPGLMIALILLAQHAATLFRPRWSWLPPTVGLATSIASLVILYPLLHTSPLVSIGDIAQTPLHELKVGKLDKTLHFAVLFSWIGVFIAMIVYAVKCFRFGRDLLGRAAGASAKPIANGGNG